MADEEIIQPDFMDLSVSNETSGPDEDPDKKVSSALSAAFRRRDVHHPTMRMSIQQPQVQEEKENGVDPIEEEIDFSVHLQGLDITKLAIDGNMINTVLEQVFQQFGITDDLNKNAGLKKRKTPEEIKIAVQNHIITQLGRLELHLLTDVKMLS